MGSSRTVLVCLVGAALAASCRGALFVTEAGGLESSPRKAAFGAGVLDGANAIVRLRILSTSACPGVECTDTSFDGDCACPNGSRLTYSVSETLAGEIDPALPIVVPTRDLEAPLRSYGGGSMDFDILAPVHVEDGVATNTLSDQCGIPGTEAVGGIMGPMFILDATANRAVEVACVLSVFRLAGDGVRDTALASDACSVPLSMALDEVAQSRTAVPVRSHATATARPGDLDFYTKTASRGPFWCAWGKTNGSSSTGGGR